MHAEEEVEQEYYPHLFTVPEQFGKVFKALHPHSGRTQTRLLVDFIEMGMIAEEIVYGDRTKIPDEYNEYMNFMNLPALSQFSKGSYQVDYFETSSLTDFALSGFTKSDNKITVTLLPKMENRFREVAERHNTTVEELCSVFAGCGLAAYRKSLASREIST